MAGTNAGGYVLPRTVCLLPGLTDLSESIQGDKERRKSKYTITMICLANTESLSEVDLAAS